MYGASRDIIHHVHNMMFDVKDLCLKLIYKECFDYETMTNIVAPEGKRIFIPFVGRETRAVVGEFYSPEKRVYARGCSCPGCNWVYSLCEIANCIYDFGYFQKILQLCGEHKNPYHDQAILFANIIFGHMLVNEPSTKFPLEMRLVALANQKYYDIVPVAKTQIYQYCSWHGISVADYKLSTKKERYKAIYADYCKRFTRSYVESMFHQVKAFMGLKTVINHFRVGREYDAERLNIKEKSLVRAQIATRHRMNPRPMGNDGGNHFQGWMAPFYFDPYYSCIAGAHRTSIGKNINTLRLVTIFVRSILGKLADFPYYEDTFGPPRQHDLLCLSIFLSRIKRSFVIGYPVINGTFETSFYRYVELKVAAPYIVNFNEMSIAIASLLVGVQFKIGWMQQLAYDSYDPYVSDEEFKKTIVQLHIAFVQFPQVTKIERYDIRLPYVFSRFPCPQLGNFIRDYSLWNFGVKGGEVEYRFDFVNIGLQSNDYWNTAGVDRGEVGELTIGVDVYGFDIKLVRRRNGMLERLFWNTRTLIYDGETYWRKAVGW